MVNRLSIDAQRIAGPRRGGPCVPRQAGKCGSVDARHGVRPGAAMAWERRELNRAEHHGSAVLLGHLIEQMGGAETSFVTGGFVNLRA